MYLRYNSGKIIRFKHRVHYINNRHMYTTTISSFMDPCYDILAHHQMPSISLSHFNLCGANTNYTVINTSTNTEQTQQTNFSRKRKKKNKTFDHKKCVDPTKLRPVKE